MKPRHFLVVAAISGGLFFANQLVFAFTIAMRDNLTYTQEQERNNSSPKEDITPQASACGGVPSRYPSHDTAYLLTVSTPGLTRKPHEMAPSNRVLFWTSSIADEKGSALVVGRWEGASLAEFPIEIPYRRFRGTRRGPVLKSPAMRISSLLGSIEDLHRKLRAQRGGRRSRCHRAREGQRASRDNPSAASAHRGGVTRRIGRTT